MALVIYIALIFESFLVYMSTASYVHTVYQNVPALIPERNKMRLARQSRDLKFCGIRIDQNTFSGEPLLADATCELTTSMTGSIYMLKEEVIVTQKRIWGIYSRIPICAKTGSSLEVDFTPNTGWGLTHLFNVSGGDPFDVTIVPMDNKVDDNVRTSLSITVEVDSFRMYVNGTEYVVVPFEPATSHYPEMLQLHAPDLDIHQVIYRAAPTPA